MKKSLFIAFVMVLFCSCLLEDKPFYSSDKFSVYPDRVVQDSFEARALSATQLVSSYKSAAFQKYNPTIEFKFSINSHDNELPAGVNHTITLKPVNGKCETNLVFGKQTVLISDTESDGSLPKNTAWTVKLDMRPVFKAFETKGFYATAKGDIITKADFNAVYIAGNAAPLSWDFSNLYARPAMELKDAEGDSIFEISLVLNNEADAKSTSNSWTLTKDISTLPTYSSDYMLSDAIYNLSLEEMLLAIEKDSTFRTGKEWAGVWTRDISYSIFLSMAYMQPEVAKKSLMRKVQNNRIIQDTGTGGAYPVSTDRIIWTVAAWELYKVTGDRSWLKYAYEVIKNSIADDQHNAFNPQTGMMKGESSFLDWREQSYPTWMQPSDIYQSENLGTNAAHYQANIIASKMALLLNEKQNANQFTQQAATIKNGIQRNLWLADKNYHGQYLYGREQLIVSPRSETLGEALCILFGISNAEQASATVAQFPITDFGVPCFYPQIPQIPAYHNNAIWPFVQSYWALAAARAGNEKAVLAQMATIYRAAALFLTNKENYVAANGDFAGTQINSSVMLWSLSGNLALVHRLLFGIEFHENKLSFQPFVPKALKGKRTLTNFKYRNASLQITMTGYGNEMKKFTINGKPSKPEIPTNMKGDVKIEIELANSFSTKSEINILPVAFTPENPVLKFSGDKLSWNKVKNAKQYIVLKNGKLLTTQSENWLQIKSTTNDSYQVITADSVGNNSFASAPILPTFQATVYPLRGKSFVFDAFKNENLTEFIVSTKALNSELKFDIQIPNTGKYALKVRYANGNGPINTDSRCALRTVYVDNAESGIFVFPQRGTGEWQNTGFSNIISTQLQKGNHQVTLKFNPFNENMKGDANEVRLYELVVYKF